MSPSETDVSPPVRRASLESLSGLFFRFAYRNSFGVEPKRGMTPVSKVQRDVVLLHFFVAFLCFIL